MAVQYKVYHIVDERTKLIVHGFIHEIENSFKLSTNIPLSIIKICIFFFWSREYFEKCGAKMMIKGDKNDTISQTAPGYYSCYAFGSIWIPSNTSNVIKWTVKMIKNKDKCKNGVVIGIVSKEVDVNSTVSNNKDCFPSYFWTCHRNIKYNGETINNKYGKTYGKPGSILIMELNLDKGELIFYVDGECYGIAHKNIKKDKRIKYKLAVSLFHKGAEMKIIHFECI